MLKALNQLSFYVKDTTTSVSFYKKLGFEIISDDNAVGEVKLGSTNLQFLAQDTTKDMDQSFQKDAFGEPKGTGVYIYIQVDGINDYHKSLKDEGISASTEPRDWPWGNREFVVRDPDRYKLVFYEKIKS